VKKEVLQLFDIDQDVFVFDINIDLLKKIPTTQKVYSEPLKYPKVVRDLAFIIDNNIDSAKVIEVVTKSSSKLLKNIKLFDIFESDSLGKGKKSLAFELEYYDESKTLTEEEVEKEFWKSIKAVESELKAKLRG
ncbi:MAG: phenylalanine--tRNA ligase subunit beta, partial [Melioribacteraceae bacterium]|nr:phenylalanine--tRNA ligase subunit beta [Melioribacteraceae bacterium]